ncbi:MAG: aminopeptidase N [Granulosicoccus sp.]
MDTRNPVTIQRLDYQVSPWQISHTRLHFQLEATATRVHSELTMSYTPVEAGSSTPTPLRLDGIDLELLSVAIDGQLLSVDQYQVDDSSLILVNLPVQCVVSIDTIINPDANTALEGLYRSSGNFCTQCEAEGFRKITYYLDRPDVLSVFDVSIEADKLACPVLLSNGNLIEKIELGNGRHRVSWHDPHPKPCYLFALVAGALAVVEDHFVTANDRQVLLQIYVQEHNLAYCDYAMQALKRSMRWDEQVYGFEYDLERFMIVAVDDFNMGAMENKGLNVFNSRYVLADVETATDKDFMGVEAVIAHEYFHNWTGNRITCRDWFQLSLKEGLTVFRDQCFSSDMHSATVKRIEDVRLLRARQFAEDASPMAHPIRPDSYIEINNFYTLTVYEKGAEVIRMLHTLLGAKAYRSGMDEYVRRHDGSATTCDAFVDAMQSATDIDLTQFRRWYEVAGTPKLVVTEDYDPHNCRYRLTITQHTPDTPGQTDKPPMFIPVVMGLLDDQGQSIALQSGDGIPGRAMNDESGNIVIDCDRKSQSFDFENIKKRPTASLLRGFSAPVKLEQSLDDAQLALLIAHDSDGFNRWEAVQRLGERVIMAQLHGQASSDSLQVLNTALESLLADNTLDSAFKAEALQLPSIDTLAESLEKVDYIALGAACEHVQRSVARHQESTLRDLVCHGRNPELDLLDDTSMGMRALANSALLLLTHIPGHDWPQLARNQFIAADNMTDKLAALSSLCHGNSEERRQSLDEFYHTARSHKLVLDKWFSVQATSRRVQVLSDVLELYKHREFDMRNPNRVRALIGSFSMSNPVAFHGEDGAGYAFLADRVIELDKLNPQVASRLVTPLTRWSRLVATQQIKMREQLQRIMDSGSLSPDVFELVSKSLNQQ